MYGSPDYEKGVWAQDLTPPLPRQIRPVAKAVPLKVSIVALGTTGDGSNIRGCASRKNAKRKAMLKAPILEKRQGLNCDL